MPSECNVHSLISIYRVMEQTFTHTMNILKESGMQISVVAGEECITLMGQFMRVNGTMT